jgi:dihydrofolate reductase
MSRIVVSEFVSVDGVMEDPGGEGFERGGWAFLFNRGSDGDAYKMDELMAADALLLGRRTYEGFAKAWPQYTDEVGFAAKMNSMPKYVVSTTLEKGDWNNTTVIRDDAMGQIVALKAAPGGDLLVAGSGQLVQALVERELVDEYRLMVFPVILGAGRRLFGDTRQIAKLRLVEAKPVGDEGVTVHTYQV